MPCSFIETTCQHHTLHPEDGGSKVLQNVGTYCNTTQQHNSEDLDPNLHCHDNLKCHSFLIPYKEAVVSNLFYVTGDLQKLQTVTFGLLLQN
jgi:hypothetical protein